MLPGLHRSWRSERRRVFRARRLGTTATVSSSVTKLKEAKLSLSRRPVASLQSEGKDDEDGGSQPWPRASVRRRPWHSSPLRCHYRRATLVSPQDCPRVPRAAGRRRCTPSNMHRCTRRKRAVDWPRCQGLTRSTSVCCSLQMRCLAFSPPSFLLAPATGNADKANKGARNGAIGKAVRLGACRCG